MLIPIVYAVAALHHLTTAYSPLSLLAARVSAARPQWGPVWLLSVLSAVALVAMRAVAEVVARGGPGWVNLIVLVLAWHTIRLAVLAVGVACRCAAAPRRRAHR